MTMPTRTILVLMLSLLVLPAFAQDYIDQLRLEAEQGDTNAQYTLGVRYDNGQGVPQDYSQAHIWYNLAASDLIGEDRERSVRNRDRMAEEMTAEQIAEAQRLAREWKPTPKK